MLVAGAAAAMWAAGAPAHASEFPLPLTNTQAGISLSLSGANGTDWAVERTFHDDSIAEQIIFLKSTVAMSLTHNERNTIMIDTAAIPHVIGVNGKDGKPDSGDEGDIYYKIDRDLQAHVYSTKSGGLAAYCVKYAGPFSFGSLTYDGGQPVLGSIGDNGGPWGTRPLNTTGRFAYGQRDVFGNEWHTLTYWDDDEPLLKAAGVDSQRLGASDGHCVFVCVNPQTPVIQLAAPQGEQFYTTPVKTYHVPRIWPQTTYLTSGVKLHFVNLANAEPVEYRVQGGSWQAYGGEAVTAGQLFAGQGSLGTLEVRCGAAGLVYRRTFVLDPDYPALDEEHGRMLWADDAERQAIAVKLHGTQPFKKSYETFRGNYYQGLPYTPSDTRGSWRSGAGQASVSLANAFVVAMEGPANSLVEARASKARLLRLARLQPVGFETTVSNATPSKDFLNELGQTLQQFADAGLAYDLLIAHFRRTQHAEGVTPIEEIRIRDGLAMIAKTILQYRGNYSATSGGGDTHWAHGYELAFGTIALAMPAYKSPCYGASGGDQRTANDLVGDDGKFWNPFPDQGVAWFQAATDPAIDTPGHPNVIYPFRAEFLLTDDGWWTGPNDLVGDGDRYFTGPSGNRLVDVKYGGLANAECRVELVEMSGYESPFVERSYVFDLARRLKEVRPVPPCVARYLRRRLVHGVVPLSWDGAAKTYSAGEVRVETAVRAFNRHYEYAALPGPRALVGKFLSDLNAYYGFGGTIDAATRARLENDRKIFYDATALAMCADPASLPPHQAEPNHAPILKPLFKHVVRPGEKVRKDIVAIDPDGDPLTLAVQGLPAGAAFDQPNRRITWTPGAANAGVHIVTVSASDGQAITTRPFAIIVKADAPAGPIPAGPAAVTAALTPDGAGVQLDWNPPTGVNVAAYVIYRDGALWATTAGNVTSCTDRELIESGLNIRYHVALYNASGAESNASSASPDIIHIPGAAVGGALEIAGAAVSPDWAYQNTASTTLDRHCGLLTVTVNDTYGNTSYTVTVTKTAGPGEVTVAAGPGDLQKKLLGSRRTDGAAGTGTCQLAVRVRGDRGGDATAAVSTTFEVRRLGDVNNDGAVNADDSVQLTKRLNGLNVAPLVLRDFDLSGDGHATTDDDVLLSKILNNLVVP